MLSTREVTTRTSNVGDDLLIWANNEFNFSMTNEVAQSLCRGNMSKVWPFVIRHLKSLQSVRNVRQQISNNQSVNLNIFQNSEIQVKDHNKNELLQELLIADDTINTTSKEINQLYEDNLLENRACYFVIENTSICKNRILKYQLLEQQLQSFLSVMTKESKFPKSQEYFRREKLNGKFVLTTQALKMLNDQFNAFYKLLLKMALNKLETSKDKTEFWSLDTLYENCKEVFKKYLFKEITEYFSTQTEERMEVIQVYIDSLDLNKDMEYLQFQFKPMVGFVDKSRHPKDIALKVSLMQKAKLIIVEKGVEIRQLKIKNSSLVQDVEFETAIAINQVNDMQFRDQDKSLIREMLELDSNLHSSNANAEFLLKACSHLENELEIFSVHQTYKKSMFLDIQRFTEHKIKKQNLISSLIKSSIKRSHELKDNLKLASSTKQLISCAILNLKSSLKYPLITNEVQLFMQLSKLPLQVAKLNNCLTFSSLLSVNDNTLRNAPAGSNFGFIIKKAEEHSMFDLTKYILQRSESDVLDLQQRQHVALDPSYSKHLLKNIHSDYCNKITVSRPTIYKETINRTEWKKKFDNLKSCLDIWWNQPLADLNLPCAVNKANYQQWQNQWMISNHMLEDSQQGLLEDDSLPHLSSTKKTNATDIGNYFGERLDL